MTARLRYCLILALAFSWLGAGSPPAIASPLPAVIVRSANAKTALRTPPPDVILLIGIDALRADHLPAYGYFRSTTPNLDYFIGSQGQALLSATSPAPWTFPSNGAVHTGLAPFRMGLSWLPFAVPVPQRVTTLAEYLQQAGYLTAGFVSNSYVSHYVGFGQGFDHFDDSLIHVPQESPACAERLTDQVITWTTGLTETGPLFLFVYYIDPHTWYNPPPPYDLFYDPVYTGTLTPAVYGNGNGAAVTSPRDFEHLAALYDGEISYTDAQIGRLLAHLDGRGMLDNALIAVYADHGDQFGEHNLWVHGNSIYEELLRVPLLFRYTGVIAPGREITTPVQTTDVTPTILDYAGIPVPPGLDGVSLRPLLEGNTPAATRPIYGEIDPVTDPAHWAYGLAPLFALRSLRLGDWKYIHHVRDEGNDELYHLSAASPYETQNLILSEPERAAAMRSQIQSYFMLHHMLLPALMVAAAP